MTTDPTPRAHPSPQPRVRDRNDHRDVIVVGARAAGASTAMLLARAGVDVLAIDRAAYGSDTLSSHALMRGAVDQLQRWGLLDQVAAVTPAIVHTVFEFGHEPIALDTGPVPLYAPRRTVLDPILVDAAGEAGAEFRFGVRMVDVIRDDLGRVRGVEVETSGGRTSRITADLVVGADGLRSAVARRVGASVTRQSRNFLSSIYAYVRGAELSMDDYHFAYHAGEVAGSIPTNDEVHCVFVSMAPDRFRDDAQLDVELALRRTLARVSPTLAEGARVASPVGPIRSFPGHVGQLRAAHGPGWALVGDAGYFKDPAAAHGLSDAFRDAELLADAVVADDLDGYERVRDNLSMPLFDHIERLTALDWDTAGAQTILFDFARSMSEESQALSRHRDSVSGPVG